MSAALYIFYILMIHPLVIYNGYAGVSAAKSVSLVAASAVFVIAQVAEFLIGRNKPERMIKKPLTLMLCSLAFLIVISALLSEHKSDVLLGYYGWWNGALPLIVCILAALVLSLIPKHAAADVGKLSLYAYIGLILPCLLALFDAMGADIFGWRGVLESGDARTYTSTVGNYSWFASMLMCVLPLAYRGYVSLRKKCGKSALRLPCIIGMMIIWIGYIVTATDVSLFVFPVLAVAMITDQRIYRENERLLYITETAGAFLASTVIVWLVYRYDEKTIIREGIIETAAGNGILTGVALLLFAVGIASYVITSKKSAKTAEKDRKKKKKEVNGFAFPGSVRIMFGIGMCILSTAGLWLAPFVGDDFGNGRGFIWKTALKELGSRDIRTLLFGSGPDTFYTIYDSAASDAFVGSTLTVAHNVILNASVNLGMIAAILLLVIIFTLSYGMLGTVQEKPDMIWLCAVLAMICAVLSVGYICSVNVGIMVIAAGVALSYSQ